eukprot:2024479-Rhodomonas_salina.1
MCIRDRVEREARRRATWRQRARSARRARVNASRCASSRRASACTRSSFGAHTDDTCAQQPAVERLLGVRG